MSENEKIIDCFFIKNEWKRIILNISGSKYEISTKKLNKMPRSRFFKIYHSKTEQEIKELCDDFDVENRELFFERDNNLFSYFINYYRLNEFHFPINICIKSFDTEMLYWGLNKSCLSECCYFNYLFSKEGSEDQTKKLIETNESTENEAKKQIDIKFKKKNLSSLKETVWDLMNNPKHSLLAKVIAIFSMLIVFISLLNMVLNTMPLFKLKQYTNKTIDSNSSLENKLNRKEDTEASFILVENPIFDLVEIICNAWFTIEFLIRLFSCQSILKFSKSFLNIIDFLTIVPFYFTLIVSIFFESKDFSDIGQLIALVKILRIIRLFKLARHSFGLQSLGLTILASFKELSMLLIFLIVSVLFFSSFIYFAENGVENTQFVSIPASFWWAIITITTVGYGDIVPVTFFGKTITSLCCVFGLLVIAMPIPIIANNFSQLYNEIKYREKILRFKKELENEMIEENGEKQKLFI